MTAAVAAAVGRADDGASILAIDPAGPDRFIAHPGGGNHVGTVFGGRLIAQSLLAAMRTVAALPVSSLHAYFLAPGTLDVPLDYRVGRLRDSRRFANRQVMVEQGGEPIFTLMGEFHAHEPGFAHQAAAMPDVPPPEAVPSLQEAARACRERGAGDGLCVYERDLPVEVRPVAPEAYFLSRPARPARDFWFRVPDAPATGDPRVAQALLAFASDYWLAGAAAIPHALPANGEALFIASLDHALWFHRPVEAGQWLLHATSSPSAGDGLGFARGAIFDRGGRLVASTAQECLLRPSGGARP